MLASVPPIRTLDTRLPAPRRGRYVFFRPPMSIDAAAAPLSATTSKIFLSLCVYQRTPLMCGGPDV